jgi:hypothetical protein
VAVCEPKLRPPNVTPAVAVMLGASSRSRVAGERAPGRPSATVTGVVGSLLISTTRVLPSGQAVAHTLTGPGATLTGKSRAPGGSAWANTSIP